MFAPEVSTRQLESKSETLGPFTEIRVDVGCFTNGYTGWGMISSDCVGVLLVATTIHWD